METETTQEPIVQETPNIQVAPGNENELDNALKNAFPNESHEITEEQPKPVITQPEAKEPASKDQTQETPKVDPVIPDKIPDQPPGRPSTKTTEAWTAMKTATAQAKQAVKDREEEIAKLKQSLADKGTTTAKEAQELKTQVQELAKYRAMVDIQADPDFMGKYDKPIATLEDGMRTMLRTMGVNDETIKGLNFGNTELLNQVIDFIKDSPQKLRAGKFQSKVEELISLRDERDNALTEAKDNYEKFMEDRKKQAFSKGAEDEGRAMRHIDGAILHEANKDKFPFLHKIVVADGAPAGEVEKATRHNKLAEMMTNEIREMVKWSEPEKRAEMATAAVCLRYANAQVKSLTERLAAVEAELGKVSTASSENDKTKNRTTPRQDGNLDLDSALNAHNWSGK